VPEDAWAGHGRVFPHEVYSAKQLEPITTDEGGLYGRRFATRREAMDWLNLYKHKRLHSTWGHVSPMTFAQRWTAAQQQDRKSASLVA
jgi:transposase InsO family protein